MAVERLWVRGYRSLADLSFDVGPLTVVQGANASGKTNLYRSLLILARGASGRLASTVLEEGGMPSMMWAGEPRPTGSKKRQPVRVTFGVQVDGVSYELNLGLPNIEPNPDITSFFLDADIKEEQAWIGKRTRHSLLLDRSGSAASATNAEQESIRLPAVLDTAETALAQIGEPAAFPELFALRARLNRWRFYHHFSTEPDAPSRTPRPGVRTPVIADDGRDLAAALATIREAGRGEILDELLEAAFPGATLGVTTDKGIFTLTMQLPGLRRPLSPNEFSDGTLRYLCLAAALLSPQPPELLVLNEPETSLHPDVLEPLATLISVAAGQTQVIVTTHAHRLADALTSRHEAELVQLVRGPDGQTEVSSE